ncbi:glycosyltransferase family 2 protein [Rossellomorea vietnamensis]|uniref:glycosyltransferase family 2 protein n=1 Tax=Rossellomorea vietnamensis TaxID=218284 RepID=UPI001E40ED04|nr:glycosyltransferase family 2 protein [Rossellomorea vietnamensis]MCC5803197.1 glycosyltransferase family 2 protein [Rossellomorea vietnamensis]
MKLKNFLSFNKNEDEKYFEKVPYEVYNQSALSTKTEVTVVVPVYNAEKYLAKTVDSVIVQNIGFQNITLILVDDGSNDKSRSILKKYAALYSNIVVIFLGENTGTPAFPRNLGAHLANSEYLTFLDADDWLSHDGISQLYNLLEETKSDYAVGKTIQIDSKTEKIVGRYESCKVRKNVSPYSIPHIFYHLGPRARMMRLSFVQENKIRYPEMKFAEDKQFFIDVLTAVGDISTTTAPIYYLNRIPENDSLTKQTNIMEKMDTNITVLKYVLDKGLKADEEKMIVNRLVEFDSITRLFDRKHFVKSENKQKYYDKFEEVLAVFRKYKRPYSLEELIKKPINKVYYDFLINKQYDKVQALAEWSKLNGEKSYKLIDELPYTIAHLNDGSTVRIEIPAEAKIISEVQKQDQIVMEIEVKGHQVSDIQGVEFQSRESIIDTFTIKEVVKNQMYNLVTLSLKAEHLQELEKGGYIMSLQYADYEKLMITKDSDTAYTLQSDQRSFEFYRTIKGNLSIKVK